MLQLTGNTIHENRNGTQEAKSAFIGTLSNGQNASQLGNMMGGSYTIGWPSDYHYHTTWHNYPVYVATDRTEKAIKILQALESEKVIEVKSVKRFIELVEKLKELI